MDTQAFENMPVTKAVLVNAVPAVLSMLVTLVYNAVSYTHLTLPTIA